MTMPDLGTGLISPTLLPCSLPNSKPATDFIEPTALLLRPIADEIGANDVDSCVCDVNQSSTSLGGQEIVGELEVQLAEEKIVERSEALLGANLVKSERFLPFLVGAPKLDQCLICRRFICPGEEISCSVRGCRGAYHLRCTKKGFGLSKPKKFKCPQHACPLCEQRVDWRCIYCTVASHDRCAPWPEAVIHIPTLPGKAICWRHPKNWWEQEHEVPTRDFEEIFCRLPVPYFEEDFTINMAWKDEAREKAEPPIFLHIKKNRYIAKKKRDSGNDGLGCVNCLPTCNENCVCRVQCVSCSKTCRCSEACTNRPFGREKKIKIIKTEHCGWGVEAAESINKGEFIIEYIGEVIDDLLCERRLWDMKHKGTQNFYMCEISKDFTIDATFKGNASRFLNHSCNPNCLLEKWQVDGETRVGIFAGRSIQAGEQLTYDYRFVLFGPEVKCKCGAPNCQGYLGMKTLKRKNHKIDFSWGVKRKRSSWTPA